MKTTDFVNKYTEDAEYDDEAGMAKNSLHTIIRVATHLEHALADDENLPEWVQEKIGAIKGMMVSVMDYVISQHEMGQQHHVPTFDADAVMESFEDLINEATIKPEQMAQLNQLKRSMQQQAMMPKSVDADTQAEIDAWERDFAAAHGSRTFAQDNATAEPADDYEDWRTRSRDTRKKLRAQRIKADQLISMGEKMLTLIDRSEKFPGGIPPGLRSDLENLEAAFDEQNPDYDTLIDLYTKRLAQLQDFVNMKRAVYRKPKTPRYNEGAPIATTPDSIDPGGATDNFKQQMANNTEIAYQKKLAGVSEGWSQKYKSSINCSHPKGFSQKAHCAGKKKHNESHEVMEMTCPDCGMCQTHGTLNEIKKGQKDSNGYTRCWPGKHAEGTKKGKNGGQVRNCVPNESVTESDEYSPVAQAITRRIMLQRTDLLSKYGPERVGDAIDEVAHFVGDVEEIGTSDVSGWVRQVERNLGDYQLDEKSTSQAQFRTMAAVAHNPKFAKKVGISQSVGKEFHAADRKQNYKKLPTRADESVYSVYEDAAATCSSSVATVVGELGEGGMTRKQVNKKLGGYTNVQTKGGKIRVKGSY